MWSGVEGGGSEPTDWDKVVGPELWAVVVVYCGVGNEFGTMRVKGVFDCNVKTQAMVDYETIGNVGCFNDETKYLYERFPKNSFFINEPGVPTEAGEWIITKIKNFKYETTVQGGTAVSFDAQIKFEKQ